MFRRKEIEFSDKPIFQTKQGLKLLGDVDNIFNYDIVAYLEVEHDDQDWYLPLYEKRGAE